MNVSPLKNITKTEEGIIFLGENDDSNLFEQDYLNIRKKEGRVFTDEYVKMLPNIPVEHQLHDEWQYRAISQNLFINYLKLQKDHATVLDLGCGNGWFSAKLKSALPQLKIYALEVNIPELQQAARLFESSQITFVHGNIFKDIFKPQSFDLIIINSVIQYFPDIVQLINSLLELLSPIGEIHIIDSPFYKSNKHKQEAQKRSLDYFSQLGEKNMIQHYHHHAFDSLKDFSPIILHNPKNLKSSLLNLCGKKINPFPWIRIIKK